MTSPQLDLSALEAARRMAALSPETQKRFDDSMSVGWDTDAEAATQGFRAIGVAIGSRRAPVSTANKRKLFAFAEQLLNSGSPGLANTVATCMLEQIWPAAQNGGFDMALVDEYLGPESRGYLVAWDDFNKVRTPGLKRR